MIESQDIVRQLKARRSLPTPPGVALRLLEVLRDDEATTESISRTLGCDPALTARVLTFANSPLMGVGREVASLQRAITLLGMRRVAILALSFCLVDDKAETCPGFDRTRFWQQSLARAVFARNALRMLNPSSQEEAFVAGLVFDIGTLVMASALSTEYQQVLETAPGGCERTIREEELRQLGVTSHELGVEVLREWALPSLVVDAADAGHRLYWELERRGASSMARALCLAQQAAAALTGQWRTPERVERIHAEANSLLQLDARRWDEFYQTCTDDWHAHCETLDIAPGKVESFAEIEAEAREQLAALSMAAVMESEEMFKRASTDELTRIANRAAFQERLSLELDRYIRDDGDLLLLLIDVDRFKQVNDTYGHPLGDEVLRQVAQTIDAQVRRVDLAARYGGEEFAVLAPQCSRESALTIAERIRQAIESLRVPHQGQDLQVTASIGGAYPRRFDTRQKIAEDLISRADQQLYAAKDGGRNQCQLDADDLATEPDPETATSDAPAVAVQ